MPSFLGQIWRRFSFRELLIFLFFLLLATMIWYGHAMNSVRSATLQVAVHYKGIPENILMSDTLPDVVYIEVRDAGKRLRAYGRNLELSFDVSRQIQGDNGQVLISADQLRTSLMTLLQGTTKLQAVMPEQLSASYYRQCSKEVAVLLDMIATPATQYQLVGEPVIQPKRVTIFGSKQRLGTIHELTTMPFEVSDIRDSVLVRAALDVPEEIRVTHREVQVTLTAEQFTEKVLTKRIIPRHVPEGSKLRLFPAEVTVFLRIGVAYFNEINDSDVHVYCDFPRKNEDKLALVVKCDCPYVTLTRCAPANVEFLIEQ